MVEGGFKDYIVIRGFSDIRCKREIYKIGWDWIRWDGIICNG
jgi:hypothetical protein